MNNNTKINALKNWVAPNQNLLPDFIIGGAMKSGTTTLHHILNSHPDIFIPEDELGFFDIDNILQHSNFNFYDEKNDSWIYQSIDSDPKKFWDWYSSKYSGKENFIKGEDSTTYLASRNVAERIAIQEKPVKLIFLLRHPTLRAYSNYWHLLRAGRATYSFEDTIRFNPFPILNRGLYKEQLHNFYAALPRERIKIILFENLINNPQKVVKELSGFLNIDFSKFDSHVFNRHSNKGRLPVYINLKIRYNYLMRKIGNSTYNNFLPQKPDEHIINNPSMLKAINRVHSIINPSNIRTSPPINAGTKSFLDEYYKRELAGINELVGKDVWSTWFGN